jgi:hypothetical protein
MTPEQPSIRELVERTGKTTLVLCAEAGISQTTLTRAKMTNQWPRQARPRAALQKLLGVAPALVEA